MTRGAEGECCGDKVTCFHQRARQQQQQEEGSLVTAGGRAGRGTSRWPGTEYAAKGEQVTKPTLGEVVRRSGAVGVASSTGPWPAPTAPALTCYRTYYS